VEVAVLVDQMGLEALEEPQAELLEQAVLRAMLLQEV
jgi:hypothetical protein